MSARDGFRFRHLRWVLALGAATAWACGTASDDSTGPGEGTGGTSAGSGGTSGGASTGGSKGSGGTSGGASGSGGSAGSSAGGAAGSAGSAGTAGSAGNAGSGGAGGSSGSGGTAGSGGSSIVDASVPRDAADARAPSDVAINRDAPAAPVVFGRNVRVNDDTGNGEQSEVAMATGAGLVITGWMDSRANPRTCAYSVSSDDGATWSRNVAINMTPGSSFVGDPSVAVDSAGTLYAVCQEYLNVGVTGNIRMMSSTDRGVTWSAVRTVQSAPDKPWVGGGYADGMVFVSWLGSAAGIKRSLDHGMTWEAVHPIGNIIHGTAIVASTTGLLHVPFNLDSARNQLRYVRSKDNGVTYDAPRDLVADMGTFCFTCSPRQHPIVGAAADPTGKYVAIVWSSQMPGGQADDDVWLLYSKDGGDTWTQPIRVNDNTAASRQFESWVAVDNYGRVHVAWTDLRNGRNETWYARSADPTRGFEPNLQVTDGSGLANVGFLGDYKSIVVNGPDVLVVWEDTRNGNGDIYFARAPGAAGP